MCRNRDETAHKFSFNIIKDRHHQLIGRNIYYFNVHIFIDHQFNKRSFEDWKLCRHNHVHYGKADNSLSDIVEVINLRNYDSILGKDKVD